MAIQYRQLQSPALIDTSSLDTGASQAAQTLAGAFKQFETGLSSFNTQLQTKRGQEAGAAAGADASFGKEGGKDFKRSIMQFTAFSQAYNNSALRSYTIQAQSDMTTTAARLQLEAGDDPATFSKTFGAVRDGVLKAAPPEARAVLNEMYTQRLTEGTVSLMQAQAAAQKQQARTDLSEGIQMSTDRIAQLSASDDPAKHAEAEDEEVKLQMMIDGARNDGTLTPIEAEAVHKQSRRAITQQQVTARFRNELENPYGDPIKFIERLKEANKTSNALLPDEEEKLVNSLLSDLQEHNSLASAARTAQAHEEKARMEAGDRQATSELLAGTLTRSTLLDMVRKQTLSPEVARTLLNELQSGDPGVDDSKTEFDVRTNLLKYSEAEIASMPGLKWSTRGDLLLKRREEAQGWKGTQAAREGENRIDRALGIVPGTMIQTLSDEVKTQRNQALTEWYSEVDKLPADQRQSAVINTAEDVIGRYIRKNNSTKAQELRAARARKVAKLADMTGKLERDKAEKQIAQYDKDIAAAEAEAARK